jgi:hypothetical protein
MSDESTVAHNFRAVPAGMTRNCVDPWEYIEFTARGEVRPCCVRPPIGNLQEQNIASILNGSQVRELRSNLLTGNLDLICKSCHLAPPVEIRVFQERIRGLVEQAQPMSGFSEGAYLRANPDVAEAREDPRVHFSVWGRLEARPLSDTNSVDESS